MADYSVQGEIQLDVSKAQASLEALAASTDAARSKLDGFGKTSTSTSKATEQTAKSTKRMVDQLNDVSFVTASVYLGMFGKQMLGVGKTALQMSMDFEQAMSDAKAALTADIPDQTKLGEVMINLRDTAIEVGKQTVFSTAEAADGITQLAKAGMDAATIQAGGLKAAMDLAASGNLGVAESAELVASAMNQFSESGVTATQVADVFAATANLAQGDVSDLELAFAQLGPTAARMGLSIEETSAAVMVLSEMGVTGRRAGTSLRAMFSSIVAPTEKARRVMDELGLSFYDANGSMLDMAGIGREIQTTFQDGSATLERYAAAQGMSAEEARNNALQILFLRDGANAANAMLKGGGPAIEDATAQLSDMASAAAIAAQRQDNLAGDVEKLQSAMEGLVTSTDVQGWFRGIVQGVTDFVDLHPGIVKTGAAIAVVTGGLALLISTGMKIGTVYSGLTKAFDSLSTLGPGFAVVSSGLSTVQQGFVKLAAAPFNLIYEGGVRITESFRAAAANMTLAGQAGLGMGAKLRIAGAAAAGVASGLASIALAVAPVAAMMLAFSLWDRYQREQREAKEAVDTLTASIDAQTGQIDKAGQQSIYDALVESANGVKTLSIELDAASVPMEDFLGGLLAGAQQGLSYVDALRQISPTLADAAAAYQFTQNIRDASFGSWMESAAAFNSMSGAERDQALALGKALFGVSQEYINQVGYIDDATEASRLEAAAIEASEDALSSFVPWQKASTKSAQEHADAEEELANSLEAVYNATFKLANAQLAGESAWLEYRQAVLEAGKELGNAGAGFDDNSIKGIENIEVMNRLIKTSQDYFNSLVDQGKSTTEISSDMEGLRSQFEQIAKVLGGETGAAEMMAKYDELITNSITNTQALTADTEAQVAALQREAEAAAAYNAELIAMKPIIDAATASTFKNAVELANVNGTLLEQKDYLYGVGAQLGLTSSQVDAYIANLLRVPPEIVTNARATGVDAVEAALNYVTRQRTAQITANLATIVTQRAVGGGAGTTLGFAEGGRVRGPGTWTSDSILGRLSRDEFVVPAWAAAQNYAGLEYLRKHGHWPKGYADGGRVEATNRRVSTTAPIVVSNPSAEFDYERIIRGIASVSTRESGTGNVYIYPDKLVGEVLPEIARQERLVGIQRR